MSRTRARTAEERRAVPTGYAGQKAPRFVSEQDGCLGYGATEAESRHPLRRELSYITRHKEDRPRPQPRHGKRRAPAQGGRVGPALY